MRHLILAVLTLTTLAVVAPPASPQTPKRGGILNAMLGEDPPGLSIHEAATISTVWPMLPCYSNLVLFDQAQAKETVESVRLAGRLHDVGADQRLEQRQEELGARPVAEEGGGDGPDGEVQ